MVFLADTRSGCQAGTLRAQAIQQLQQMAIWKLTNLPA